MNLDRLFSLGIWILVVFLSSPCALGFNDLKRPEFLHSSLWKGLKLRLQLSALLFSPPPFTLAAALWNFCHELIEFTGLPFWNLLFSIWSFLSSFFKVCDLSFQYFHLTYLLYALQSDQGESSLMLTFFLHENSLPNPFSKFVHSLWRTFLPAQQFKPCHWHLILCLRCLASLFIKGTINLIFMVRWSLRLPGEITKKMFPCSQLPRHPTSFRPSMQAVVASEKMTSSSFLLCLPLRAMWQMGCPATLQWQLPSTLTSWWPWGRMSASQSGVGPWLFFLWQESLMFTYCQDTICSSTSQVYRVGGKTSRARPVSRTSSFLHNWSYHKSLFHFSMSLLCWLNLGVYQFGKIIMEVAYSTVL